MMARFIVTRLMCGAAALLVLCTQLPAQDAATQGASPSTNVEDLPRLDLTPAQKQTIYTSITNLRMKNEALPDFQPIVGAVVPEAIDLEDLPKTIREVVPQTEGFKVAMVSGRVVLVEPRSRRIVDAIVGEKG